MRGLLLFLLCVPTAYAQETFQYGPNKLVSITHEPGDEIQVFRLVCKDGLILVDKGSVDILHYPEDAPTLTVWTAPPGQYQMNHNGRLSIVNIGKVNTDPVPDPDPPGDVPVVPTDRFDNIGRKVVSWTVGLTRNADLGRTYREYANEFVSSSETVTALFDEFNGAVREVLDGDTSYDTFRENYIQDLQGRWPKEGMSRPDLKDYFTAIAVGLEASL